MKEDIIMGRLKIYLMFSMLILAMGVGSAWGIVGLPTANFSGNAKTTAPTDTDPGSLTLVNNADTNKFTTISQVNYLDGSSRTVNNTNDINVNNRESIIGKQVTISGATRTGTAGTTFTNAVITVSDGTFNYFSATLSNIMFVLNPADGKYYLNPGLDINNPATLNMTNVVFNTDEPHPSRYINELKGVAATSGALGMKMILQIISGNFTGDSTSDISVGLLDGTPLPTVTPPAGARSMGFWKNHDEERNSFIGKAVYMSNVFNTENELNEYLSRNGKKTMDQKAMQQLAALMLNVASSLPLSTELTAGELQILQQLDPAAVTGATVEDALCAIEQAIIAGTNLDDAKDLADEINNRDHKS